MAIIKDWQGKEHDIGHKTCVDHGNFVMVGSSTITTKDPWELGELDLEGFDDLIYKERYREANRKIIQLVEKIKNHEKLQKKRYAAMKATDLSDIRVNDANGD